MKGTMLAVLAAAGLAAGSAEAQVISGPALPEGSTSEYSLSVTQPEVRGYSTSGAGVAGTFRSTAGRMNLSARAAYLGNLNGGAYAELGTFGAVPLPRIGGVDIGWTAGMGYDTGNGDGLYVPLGIDVSRAFDVGAARVTPFAHGRVSFSQHQPAGVRFGEFTTAMEMGLDVGAGTGWSVRAGYGAAHGSEMLVLGFAFRR